MQYLVADTWRQDLNLNAFISNELMDHYVNIGFFYWYEELCAASEKETRHGIPLIHPEVIRETTDFAVELDDIIGDMAMQDCEATECIKRNEDGTLSEEEQDLFDEYLNANFWEYFNDVTDDVETVWKKNRFHYAFSVRTGIYSTANIVVNFPIVGVW